MTRREADAKLRRLALGLEADAAGVRKLLERVSLTDEAETLRAALVEEGALAIIDGGHSGDGAPAEVP